jgi:ribonuclease BN (tRNA processing enzyme)
VKLKLWGTRGSLASPGPETVRYGGNTSCVSIEGSEGTLLVLDAGTGILRLGQSTPPELDCVHILLTQLHMDHIQGLPFFAPLRRRGVEVHIWGPASTTLSLRARLMRYLSPPLFPVSLREIWSDMYFHELPAGTVELGELRVDAQLVIHPNPTVGYRVMEGDASIVYLPDHEPALSARQFPGSKEWTSGYSLAEGADLLIHDSQYTQEMYQDRVGFGHSSLVQALQFAGLAEVRQLVPFHHDPTHGDAMLDQWFERTLDELQPRFLVTPAQEGQEYLIGG